MSGAPSSGTPLESQAKFRDGTMWVLEKGPVGTGPAGSVFGENSWPTWKSSSRTGPSASCGYCCPRCPVGDQFSGKFRFIEKPEVHDEGVALWLNVVLTPGLPLPQLKFSYGT